MSIIALFIFFYLIGYVPIIMIYVKFFPKSSYKIQKNFFEKITPKSDNDEDLIVLNAYIFFTGLYCFFFTIFMILKICLWIR